MDAQARKKVLTNPPRPREKQAVAVQQHRPRPHHGHHASFVRAPSALLLRLVQFANPSCSRRPLLSLSLPLRTLTLTRGLHHSLPLPPVPHPNDNVPDVETFLKKIGRQCEQHASKFESWEQLFNARSEELKDLGIEPARTRRYIVRWRETFRRTEGAVELYEQKQGRKIDGGERRRKHVRAKRYQEERKKAAGEEGAR